MTYPRPSESKFATQECESCGEIKDLTHFYVNRHPDTCMECLQVEERATTHYPEISGGINTMWGW